MKRGEKGSRSNETNFFLFFFFCSPFSTIVLSNLRAIRFFSTGERGCLSSQRDRGARVAIRNPGKCCSIVSYNGSSPREHSDMVAIAPVRGLQGKSRPPQALARFCCESKHAFLLFYQLRTTGPYV